MLRRRSKVTDIDSSGIRKKMNEYEAEPKNILMRIGLTDIEIDIWSYLLEHGVAREKELRDVSGKSLKDLYQVLASLFKKGFIARVPGMEMSYAPIKPSVCMRSLIDQVEWIPQPIWVSEDDRNTVLHSLSIYTKILTSSLDPIYEKNKKIPAGHFWGLYGSEEISLFLAMLIESAAKEICSLSIPPWLPMTTVWKAIVSKLSEGIQYKRIIDKLSVALWGLRFMKRDIESFGVELKVASDQLIKEKYYVIDDEWVLFRFEDIIEGKFVFIASAFHSPKLARRYTMNFNRLWSNSTPAKKTIEELRNEAKKMLDEVRFKISKEARRVFGTMVDMGIFTRFRDFSVPSTKAKKELRSLEKLGMIVHLTLSSIGYIPNFSIVRKSPDVENHVVVQNPNWLFENILER